MRTIFFFTFLLFLTACSSIDCPVQNLVETQYALMDAYDNPDILDTDTLNIWTRRVDGTDTLVLNSLYGEASTFSLPISYTQPEDIFCLRLNTRERVSYQDTIRIEKENYPHFESVDCQAAYFHDITAVSSTHNFIDSVTIHHSQVNYDVSNTHIYIYLKANR
jgi:hypothetical protein